MWARALGVSGALVALVASVETPALADDAREAARKAYARGAAAYDAGDYPAAARAFASADELAPSDVALDQAMKSAMKADDVVLALELADRGLARPLPFAIRSTVEAVRTAMEPRAGHLSVHCAPEVTCTATVDDVAFGVEKATWVRAGDHHVVVTAGEERQSFHVYVSPRGDESVTARPTILSAEAPRWETPRDGLSPVWFWAGTGVTALLGAGTIASGIDTQSKHDDFVRSPTSDGAQSGKDAQLRTNVLLIGTGAAALITAAIGIFAVDWHGRPRAVQSGAR